MSGNEPDRQGPSKDKELLLVLDCCEHVIELVAPLSDWQPTPQLLRTKISTAVIGPTRQHEWQRTG